MKLVLFLSVFILAPAYAIKGDYADPREQLPSSCKLTFKLWNPSSKKVMTGICSSSFIGKKSFITAEHCQTKTLQALNDFKKGLTPELPYFQCPGTQSRYPASAVKGISGSGYNSDYDIGMIKVAVNVDIPEIHLPWSTKQVESLLKDPSKCFINGYGLDNKDNYGKLLAAQIKELDAAPLSYAQGPPPSIRIRGGNLAVEGDSGGPMFCRTSQGPVLVGVVHGKMKSDLKYTDLHRIDKITDWIKYHRNGDATSNEDFSVMNKMQETCDYIDQCFLKLEASAKLSKDMALILKNLTQDVRTLRSQAVLGSAVDRKKLDQRWADMIAIWEKQNCYKILNP